MRWPLPVNSYRRVSSERLVNCYAQQKPADGFGTVALVRAPGIQTVVDAREWGLGRGISVFQDQLVAVIGKTLAVVRRDGVLVDSGDIPGRGLVKLAQTADRLAILTSAGLLYVWDGSTLAQVTDGDLRVASDMDFLDNYLVFTEAGSGRWFASDVNAPESYDAAMFATAEGQPDELYGLIADHGQAFLAGAASCELWQNTGGEGFPFQRVANGLIELGCAAGKTLGKLDNGIFWLANDLTVRRLQGFTPLRVSHDGVEAAIRLYGDVTDAYAMTYTFAGHLMYALTFPGKATWEFDVTTGLWHERQTYGSQAWDIAGIAQFQNDVYTLSLDGRIGVMRSSVYSEYGETQRVEFTCAPMYAEGRRAFLRRAELMMRTGSA